MLRRNGNKVIKKVEGEATFISMGDVEAEFSLPLFKTSFPGKYVAKYKITIEEVKQNEVPKNTRNR